MSKNKEIIKNIKLGLIYKPASLILSLIVVPLAIKYLGTTFYGLWATILSIISWMNYFDVGIGNGLRNHLTREITLKRYKQANEYISTAYIVIFIISVLIFLLTAISFRFLNWNSIFNTTLITNEKILIIMLINLLFISLNFILKIITTIYYSMQKSSIVGLMQIANQLLYILGFYFLFNIENSNKLIGISLVYGISSLIVNLIFSIILFTKNNDLFPKIRNFKITKIKDLTGLGIKFFIIQIAAMIIFTTDNLIITKLFGPISVTPYTITYKIFSLVIIGHSIIITPIWSAVTKAYAEKDFVWIKKIIKKLNLFQIVIIIGTIFMVIMFPYILKIWIQEQISISFLLIVMFAVYVIIATYSNVYAYIFNGIGDINFQLKIAVIQGIINIPLSIYFGKYLNMGSCGVILATNITLLLSVVLYPVHLKKMIRRMELKYNR